MWDQKIPSYIYGKQNIVRLILWTALFALVFINIYKPFSSTSWYKVSEFKFFVFSSLIILTGVLVVVLSRIILFHWGEAACYHGPDLCDLDRAGDILHVAFLYDLYVGTESGTRIYGSF